MTRQDISAAIDKAPKHVREQIGRDGGVSMEMAERYLPGVETVDWIASAAPNAHGAKQFSCLLVLTDRRLLFVASAPQALSWRLPVITRVQALDGRAGAITTFFVDDSGGGQYQLGADGEWGREFVRHAKLAITRAVISDID